MFLFFFIILQQLGNIYNAFPIGYLAGSSRASCEGPAALARCERWVSKSSLACEAVVVRWVVSEGGWGVQRGWYDELLF